MSKPDIAAPWWVIIASVALSVLLVLGAIVGLYIPRLTTHDFPVYLVGLIVIVGGLFFGVARLRPRDLGLRRSTFLRGCALTLVAWLAIQVIAGAACLFAFGHLTLNATWGAYGVVAVLGIFVLDQLLGNSLFEEIMWRGFLFPQLALKRVPMRTTR
jgi:membrane protease YdiL (CAAX protease family)